MDRRHEKKCEEKNIEIVDENSILLRCKECGQVFQPRIHSGPRFQKGWWKCPNGCNT